MPYLEDEYAIASDDKDYAIVTDAKSSCST